MKETRRILIIDDERPILLTLEALLSRHGFEIDTAGTAAAGLKALKKKSPSLVLLDLQLPDAQGLEMLDQIKTEQPETQVIILTAHDTLANAIDSIKRGAFHFISKRYAPEELLSLVEKALEKQSLLRETQTLRKKAEELQKRLELAETRFTPVFKSKSMQEIEELVNSMAPSEANVLISGESGVGKGSNREHDSSAQPAIRSADGKTELRGISASDDRRRAVRLRQRGVHRRDERFSRNDLGSGREHAFPG